VEIINKDGSPTGEVAHMAIFFKTEGIVDEQK